MVKVESIIDIHEAVIEGLGAIQYIAASIASSGRDFEFLAKHDASGTAEALKTRHRQALAEALAKVSNLLNFLGDFVNECDGVDTEAQNATESAFNRVRRTLEAIKNAKTRNDSDVSKAT